MIVRVYRKGLRHFVLAPVLLALSIGLLGAPGAAHAGDLINQPFDGVAIRGYDPVAYFTDGQAVKGSNEFTYDWLGATWHFASAEHRDLFAADPVTYAPQYGGYCASGMVNGATASANPENWRIVDGKLYMYSSQGAMAWWGQDAAKSIEKADAQWELLKADLTE